jgi:hypothetical protein
MVVTDVAAGSAIAGWSRALGKLHRRIGHRFARSETRKRVKRDLVGLLGRVDRKNGWQLAEAIGERDPQGVQLRGTFSIGSPGSTQLADLIPKRGLGGFEADQGKSEMKERPPQTSVRRSSRNGKLRPQPSYAVMCPSIHRCRPYKPTESHSSS